MPSYGVVIETGKGGYSAFVPDLPGCIAAADTLEEVRELITEAIASHIELMREEGLRVPKPTSICETVEVEA
jgi:predicted RNase H-like HicB family nuclease